MVYDAIMGVGKTPQITADVLVNPYSLQYDDVTQLAFPQVTLGGGMSEINTVLNVTNPNVDYAYLAASGFATYQINKTTAGTTTAYITYSFGKDMIFRGSTFYYNSSGSVITIQSSFDGVNWFDVTSTSSDGNHTLLLTDLRFKFIRIKADITGTTGGTDFRLVKFQTDTKQLQQDYRY